MNIKFMCAFLFILFTVFYVNSGEKKLTNREKENLYDKEKITYEVEKKFDVLYPLNKKVFSLYKGNQKISFKEFLNMSNDSVLLKYQEKIKKIKIAGYSTAIISGIVGVAFLVPGIVFIGTMASSNFVNSNYLLSGVCMMALSFVSVFILIIDFLVTFSLLRKFGSNENAVRKAIERYNEKLSKRLGIIPDFSFYESNVRMGFCFKL